MSLSGIVVWLFSVEIKEIIIFKHFRIIKAEVFFCLWIFNGDKLVRQTATVMGKAEKYTGEVEEKQAKTTLQPVDQLKHFL